MMSKVYKKDVCLADDFVGSWEGPIEDVIVDGVRNVAHPFECTLFFLGYPAERAIFF